MEKEKSEQVELEADCVAHVFHKRMVSVSSDERKQLEGQSDHDLQWAGFSDPTSAVCVTPERWIVTEEEEITTSFLLDQWMDLDNQGVMMVYPDDAEVGPSEPIVLDRQNVPLAPEFVINPDLGPPGPSDDSSDHQTSVIDSLSHLTDSSASGLYVTSQNSSFSVHDPVTAAAHLHLLGESLSLIEHHLQGTNRTVCLSGSLSLLLDSLLCAMAPLMCLTSQIPELSSCTEHKPVSSLENFAYIMPGL